MMTENSNSENVSAENWEVQEGDECAPTQIVVGGIFRPGYAENISQWDHPPARRNVQNQQNTVYSIDVFNDVFAHLASVLRCIRI